ncbi:hypothetical protein ACU4GD_10360 [Cupriavidus basilensis]
MFPDDDEQDAAAQASRQPASRAAPAPAPAPVPAANPAQAPSSARMVKNPPPPPPTSAAPAAQATSEPRFCCTVAGRLKPYNSAAFDADTNVGDACQGVTHRASLCPVPPASDGPCRKAGRPGERADTDFPDQRFLFGMYGEG